MKDEAKGRDANGRSGNSSSPPLPRSKPYSRLNLGCGSFVPGFENWLNVDHRSELADEHRHFLCHDITRPLPLPDATIDVIYSEHVLEHFDMESAALICHDVFRVLKPGGIFRVVVPDAILRRGSDSPEVLPCADGHKTAWTYHSLRWLLENVGFRVAIVKYWDETGRLHVDPARMALALGVLRRPESLIADALKPSANLFHGV